MEFYYGLIVGIFTGANIGVVIFGLLSGCKQRKNTQDLLWDCPYMEEAVLDKDPTVIDRSPRSLPEASADPIPHF